MQRRPRAHARPFGARRAAFAIVIALAPLAAAGAQDHSHHTPRPSPDGRVPLLDGLGNHHFRISTTDSLAQRYFDQGLNLAYAFNHPEAARAFREAARRDPTSAMAEWGLAYVLGPNVNAAMDSASAVEAHAAIGRAQAKSARATERERAYIAALARRYAAQPTSDRAALDSAYADAMRTLSRRYPADLDASTLYAEALMDLAPWTYWNADATPRPGTREIVTTLEKVLKKNPDHPGACHFYIHAVEAAHPEKAVACAERLAALMPGAGHIVHMPGHIYIRVGRWNDAIEANEHAVHADETYIADVRQNTLYTAAYYPHNYHFMSFAATMAGRSAKAIEAARGVVRAVPMDIARTVLDVQMFVPYVHQALVTWGRWDDVLAEPLPPSEMRYATALAWYARGVALAATGRGAEAEGALDSVRTISATITAQPWATIASIARESLEGELAARRGDRASAIAAFERAMAMEDALPYMEPPWWYYPVRHSLATVLLQDGKAARAERLYREDLVRFPENGWSLFGLAQALDAQGKKTEAAAVRARFDKSWSSADVRLQGSRF